jgi:hypothetical protein
LSRFVDAPAETNLWRSDSKLTACIFAPDHAKTGILAETGTDPRQLANDLRSSYGRQKR